MKTTVSVCLIVAAASLGQALAQPILNSTPSRVVGHPSLTYRGASPNVVEGREFFNPAAVAVDTSSSPNAIFVADLVNNRVLGWRDAATFTNGQTADLVIGQVDKASTTAQGGNVGRSTGMNNPGALAIDSRGNLYVADSGNNRILRFPKPFATDEDIEIPNMVIGQPSFLTRDANNAGISEKSLSLSSSTLTGLAFDRQGNLWVSDAQNHRVLRFPVAALDAGTNNPAADLVLGQASFTAVVAPPGALNQTNRYAKNLIRSPSGLAVDPDGRLFVADEYSRVLVFTPPYFNNKEATRLLGVGTPAPGQPLVGQNEFNVAIPEGVFMIGDRPAVTDRGFHRILIWDPYTAWAPESETQVAPPARTVIGQAEFTTIRANRGLFEPSESTLNSPIGATYANNQLYVADANNHRVLVFPQIATGAAANRVLGQTGFNYNGANLVVGQELFLYTGVSDNSNLSGNFSDGAGVAVDTRSNPPRLYIADTFNNRILGYRDARRVRPGDKADIVIGQPDFNRVTPNSPQNAPTDGNVLRPSGLAVDSNGDLFVADSGNSRVLRFPSPFERVPAGGERYRANLVLGQSDFFTRVVDPSSRNMAYPFGLVFTGDGHLVVSDALHNRILLFRRPTGGDFTRAQAADRVIGQPDFFSAATGPANNRLSSPRHIAIDTDDRLYVADAGKNRIAIYDRVTTAGTDPSPAFSLSVPGNSQGVFVSAATGEIWIAETRRNRVARYPRFELLATTQAVAQEIASPAPLAVTQDASGNLFVAEGNNRVAVYFNGLAHQTSGNYSEREISPGGIVSIYPRPTARRFSLTTQSFNDLPNPIPLPRELADTQVLLNGQPVPLYFVDPGQINFLVPMNTPESGFAELEVIRPSTGEVISAGSVPLARVSPALFAQSDQGQVAALNEDNTINSPTNPIRKGQIIQLFGTGQGVVSGAPADGELASGQTATSDRPRVLIEPGFVPDDHILYSGLAPGLVGVWQINVRIPQDVAPRTQVEVVVQLRSVNSNVGTGGKRLTTTISVAP